MRLKKNRKRIVTRREKLRGKRWFARFTRFRAEARRRDWQMQRDTRVQRFRDRMAPWPYNGPVTHPLRRHRFIIPSWMQ